MVFGLPKWYQNHEKAWFMDSKNIEILCVFLLRIFREPWFPLYKTITFEGSAVRIVLWKTMICHVFSIWRFLKVQSSLFSVLVGSGDLQNRPWPSPTPHFTFARASFLKNHVFLEHPFFHQKVGFFTGCTHSHAKHTAWRARVDFGGPQNRPKPKKSELWTFKKRYIENA